MQGWKLLLVCSLGFYFITWIIVSLPTRVSVAVCIVWTGSACALGGFTCWIKNRQNNGDTEGLWTDRYRAMHEEASRRSWSWKPSRAYLFFQTLCNVTNLVFFENLVTVEKKKCRWFLILPLDRLSFHTFLHPGCQTVSLIDKRRDGWTWNCEENRNEGIVRSDVTMRRTGEFSLRLFFCPWRNQLYSLSRAFIRNFRHQKCENSFWHVHKREKRKPRSQSLHMYVYILY